MTQYVFGSGTCIMKRTDISNTQPALLGVLQDISIDFDQKLESLLGQNKVAVALAGGELKITGKAKWARFQATQLNNMFLGQTQTASAMLEMTTGEALTISTGAATVANGATYVEDLGVFNVATGVQLTPVASSPVAATSYVPGVAGTGTYTFATGDNGVAYIAYYSYTTTSGQKIAIANQLMGNIPIFEMYMKQSFTNFGVAKDLVLKLNACASSKFSMPFGNTKFSIAEMDFQAQADAAGNIGTLSLSE